MKKAATRVLDLLKSIHRDEQGAEGLEKLLIIAAIVLPLLGLLIAYRNELSNWVKEVWDTQRTDAGTGMVTPN